MSELFGRERMAGMLAPALAVAADGIVASAIHSRGGLTRFASSRIHQNVWREDVEIRVMAVVDGSRSGVATTHATDAGSVRRAAEDAVAIARVTPRDPHFPGLASPAAIGARDSYDEATGSAPPGARAAAVVAALAEFPAGMEGAGYVETTADEVCVASTTGVLAYARTSRGGISVMAMSDTSSGFAEMLEPRLGDLDAAGLASRAVRKAELGRDPRPIDAGAYTVVLEPAATGTLLQFLGWIAFGAKGFLEGRSFMTDRIGARVMDERVTIADDPLAPGSLGLPFDFEGTPARTVTLIERGVAKDVVWDRATAMRAGRESTGHGLPPPNADGPFPLNLRMDPGVDSVDDMIAETERGLLVTRFHYSNIVNEKETVLTGMTRDGTFLIEDGKIRHGVRNLRYTQNAVDAFAAVDAVGRETEVSSELFFGGSRAPALRVRNFKFSSTTDH